MFIKQKTPSPHRTPQTIFSKYRFVILKLIVALLCPSDSIFSSILHLPSSPPSSSSFSSYSIFSSIFHLPSSPPSSPSFSSDSSFFIFALALVFATLLLSSPSSSAAHSSSSSSSPPLSHSSSFLFLLVAVGTTFLSPHFCTVETRRNVETSYLLYLSTLYFAAGFLSSSFSSSSSSDEESDGNIDDIKSAKSFFSLS